MPNRGYGAGNNRGVEWALSHYQFKHLVISNADIEIQRLSFVDVVEDVVNAPKIVTKRGKQQNPHTPFYIPTIEEWKYRFFRKRWWSGILLTISFNKALRYVFYLLYACFHYQRIYAPHGSFVIIPESILNNLVPLFNEAMFLFVEEDHLARLCRIRGVRVCYNSEIVIKHMEDGSTGVLAKDEIKEKIRQSYLTYYEYWRDN